MTEILFSTCFMIIMLLFFMTLLFVTDIPALVGVKSTNAAVLSTQTVFVLFVFFNRLVSFHAFIIFCCLFCITDIDRT